MSKYRAIFDDKGKAYEYENGQLVWVRDDLSPISCSQRGPTVMGDLEAFVSPIDGSVISGRAAMREHCLRHNVVPTADLKGLPFRTMNTEHTSSREYREETKRTIAAIMDSKHY